jgi:KDO2-lipid IV(A) lauroyltransferase
MFGYKSFLELSKAVFISLFTFLTFFIPRSVAVHISNVLGFCAFFVLSGRRKAILGVLRTIRPDASSPQLLKMGRRILINYANNFADFLRLYHMETRELLSITRSQGLEHFERVLEEHTGAILLSAHLGNWEVGSNYMAAAGLPLIGVAESGGPGEAFYRLFKRYRQHFGTVVFSLEDPAVGFKLRKHLKSGYVVGLIGDRDIAGTGVEVEYFGRRSVFPTGPAFLSLATKAPIVPAFYLRLNEGGKEVYHAYVEEPIRFERGRDLREDVKRLTQVVASRIEAVVKRYPDQWFCFPPPWEYGSKEQRAESKE